MQVFHIPLLVVALLSSSFSSLGFAETKTATPLDTQGIETWLEAQIAIINWSRLHKDALSSVPQERIPPLEANTATILKPIAAANLLPEFNSLISELGFASAEDWASLSIQITQTAAAIALDEDDPLASLPDLNEIKNNENIPESEKKRLIRMVSETRNAIEQLVRTVSDNDKTTLKPYLDRINRTLSRN